MSSSPIILSIPSVTLSLLIPNMREQDPNSVVSLSSLSLRSAAASNSRPRRRRLRRHPPTPSLSPSLSLFSLLSRFQSTPAPCSVHRRPIQFLGGACFSTEIGAAAATHSHSRPYSAPAVDLLPNRGCSRFKSVAVMSSAIGFYELEKKARRLRSGTLRQLPVGRIVASSRGPRRVMLLPGLHRLSPSRQFLRAVSVSEWRRHCPGFSGFVSTAEPRCRVVVPCAAEVVAAVQGVTFYPS